MFIYCRSLILELKYPACIIMQLFRCVVATVTTACGYYVMQDCSRDTSFISNLCIICAKWHFMSATYPVLSLQLSVAKILQNPV